MSKKVCCGIKYELEDIFCQLCGQEMESVDLEQLNQLHSLEKMEQQEVERLILDNIKQKNGISLSIVFFIVCVSLFIIVLIPLIILVGIVIWQVLLKIDMDKLIVFLNILPVLVPIFIILMILPFFTIAKNRSDIF